MTDMGPIEAAHLDGVVQELLEKARTVKAQRAAHMLFGNSTTTMTQTLIALAAGAAFAEHDSPPEATLHVLVGAITLHGKGRQWELGAGDFVQIPPERHSVTAQQDSVFLLSVMRGA